MSDTSGRGENSDSRPLSRTRKQYEKRDYPWFVNRIERISRASFQNEIMARVYLKGNTGESSDPLKVISSLEQTESMKRLSEISKNKLTVQTRRDPGLERKERIEGILRNLTVKEEKRRKDKLFSLPTSPKSIVNIEKHESHQAHLHVPGTFNDHFCATSYQHDNAVIEHRKLENNHYVVVPKYKTDHHD